MARITPEEISARALRNCAIHELGHAWMAEKYGYYCGRLWLERNPAGFADPYGPERMWDGHFGYGHAKTDLHERRIAMAGWLAVYLGDDVEQDLTDRDLWDYLAQALEDGELSATDAAPLIDRKTRRLTFSIYDVHCVTVYLRRIWPKLLLEAEEEIEKALKDYQP